MIIQINTKEIKTEGEGKFLWYDSFFQEMIEMQGTGYTIKTSYSPYCVFKGKKVRVAEAMKWYKGHNKVDHLPDEVVLQMMKDADMVFYDYIQEAETHKVSAIEAKFEDSDTNKIVRLLDDLDLTYDILLKNTQGIRLEIEEIKDEEGNNRQQIADFLEEVKRTYNCKVE